MDSPPKIQKLESLLKRNFNGNWKYMDHTTKFLTAAGENYGSVILQVDVNYKENNNKINQLHLVVKLCPSSEILKEAFLCSISFKKEIRAYLDFCPTLEKFQTNLPEAKRLDFFAKCYGARMNLSNTETIDDNAAIVLENLKTKGYFVEDRLRGLDLTTAQLVLTNLAKLQASVIAFRLLNPTEFEKKMLPCMEKINNGGVMIDGFINVGVDLLQTIEECRPYWTKIKKMVDDRKQLKGLQFPIHSNFDFYTIVHTDFWTNNIMILKDVTNKKPLKVKMVDLQLLDYGSGIRDVLFFVYTSVQIEVFDKHFDDLLKLFHSTLIECLTDFKCDVSNFSWALFQNELNLVAPHELFHILFMIKPIFSERGSAESLAFQDVKDFGRTDNIGGNYLRKLKHIVLSFAKNNWI